MKKIDFKKFFGRKSNTIIVGPALAWPINFIRDWKMVVLVFAVGLASLSIFSWKIYLSNQIAGGYLASEAVLSDTIIKTIDQKKLSNNLLILETRGADYLKAKSADLKSVDPAI